MVAALQLSPTIAPVSEHRGQAVSRTVSSAGASTVIRSEAGGAWWGRRAAHISQLGWDQRERPPVEEVLAAKARAPGEVLRAGGHAGLRCVERAFDQRGHEQGKVAGKPHMLARIGHVGDLNLTVAASW